MQESLRQAIRGISNMTEYNEAIELMHYVRDNFRVVSARSFFKGDQVMFTRKTTGEIYHGTVTKVNSVTVSVNCGDKGKWKVTSTLLTHVPPATATASG